MEMVTRDDEVTAFEVSCNMYLFGFWNHTKLGGFPIYIQGIVLLEIKSRHRHRSRKLGLKISMCDI